MRGESEQGGQCGWGMVGGTRAVEAKPKGREPREVIRAWWASREAAGYVLITAGSLC